MLKLFFLFIYNIFDTLNCSFYSILNIVSDFFNFCSCFFRRPFFVYFFVTGYLTYTFFYCTFSLVDFFFH